ncbi:TPA: hypothetical protein ACX6QF_000952 [Photobacterium damselae]|uniref:Uncharacterized protein n=1 Tax=Photobacterium damselae TaxID=38293 RepID=A0A2X1W7R1_PHODM|nr:MULTISPECIES: hypothetical protein [Gammaproteobacteria]TGZ36491.1 hypothetical protein EQ875_00270 [Photobacterium damselae subsp. damselae]SPY24981.1 Uncharacterised protein [Photobacterium damselae]SPY27676.1 Uncharacterised protein [Photobacterium damselae]SUB66844.1 Uncharacterised protein [Photobacterium damselae]BDR34906.1 hypothetical protein PDY_19540 [Photobacterium damselae subsp. damselae]
MILQKLKSVVFARKTTEQKQAELKSRLAFAMSQSKPKQDA